jgi:hypothetical protein
VVKLVECFACAKESSLFTFDQQLEENTALEEFLYLNGPRKWSVASDGLCLISSWQIAMKTHLQKNYSSGNAALKFDAVDDLRKNPNHYQLIGNYEDDFERFLKYNDYAGNSIDLLPYALANITGVCCIILQVDKNGEIRTFNIPPLYDIPDNEPIVNRPPEITLIYSPTRQHYDVALTCDEYQAMVMERTEAQKVCIDLSIDEDVIDESECSDSSIDNEDMYRDIFADDPDSSDDEDFTFCVDDKEIKLFLRSKSIKELKLLAEQHKISLVNVIEKQDLVVRLASNPTLKICVSKDMGEKKAAEVKERKRSKKVDPSWWEDIEAREVEKIPYDIDGTCVFKLSFDPIDRLKSSADGRSWEKSYTCNTKEFPNGRRKAAKCGGSYTCINNLCMFYVQYGKENNMQWKKTAAGTRLCKCCNHLMQHIPCEARKIWEFYQEHVIVRHLGFHTCPARIPMTFPEEISETFSRNPKTKPSKLQRDILVNSLRESGNVNAIKELASNLLDKKKLRNEKQKQSKVTHPHGHSFDAVVHLKRQLDAQDPFLIFEINGEGMNENPSYVFKSSTFLAKIALEMDRSGNHYMLKEWVFFDAAHKRCRGFKTFSITTFHPLLRKIVKLATMECKEEDTRSVKIMWELFNKVLQTVSSQNFYKFNPCGWMVDEAGSNWKGLKEVYGDDVQTRIVSCQFHYQQSRNDHRRKLLTDEERDIFTGLSNALFTAVTPSGFMESYEKCLNFIKSKPNREHVLLNWLTWWYSRRSHVFPAFRPLHGIPSTNLAESFNSIWYNSDTNNLSLVDAAYYDTVESLMLETEFECFKAGTFKGGDGPDFHTREQKERVEQMRRARVYAEEIRKGGETISEGQNSCQNASDSFTPTSSSHRPDKRSSSSEHPTSFKKHKGSQQREAKWRQTRSKVFQQSLKKVKNEPFQLVSANLGKHEFMVYSVNSRNTYLVSVTTTPHCECPFYIIKQNNTQQICKHILWVYLFVLEIPEESKLINQVALLKSEVLELTSNAPAVIPPRLFRPSSTRSGSFAHNIHLSASNMPSTSTANISSGKVPKMTNDEINGLFEGSPLNTAPQVWTAMKKIDKGKQPSCAGVQKQKNTSRTNLHPRERFVCTTKLQLLREQELLFLHKFKLRFKKAAGVKFNMPSISSARW